MISHISRLLQKYAEKILLIDLMLSPIRIRSNRSFHATYNIP